MTNTHIDRIENALTGLTFDAAAEFASLSLPDIARDLAEFVGAKFDDVEFPVAIRMEDDGALTSVYVVPASYHPELERDEDETGDHLCHGFEVFIEEACELHPDAVILRPCCDVGVYIFASTFPAPYEVNPCLSCSAPHVATFAFFPHLFLKAAIKPSQEDIALKAVRAALRGDMSVHVEVSDDNVLGGSPVTFVPKPTATSRLVPLTALTPDVTTFCYEDDVLQPDLVRQVVKTGFFIFE
jgi:hypothetical protein